MATAQWYGGLSQLAITNAEAALRSAQAYALNRRQGGATIASHSAVSALLQSASEQIQTARTIMNGSSALTTKNQITQCCVDAVNHCLQVFGGNGYLYEYPIAMRLRFAWLFRAIGNDDNE